MEIGYEFEIISFRAIDEPELCQKFVEGHTNLLNDIGVQKLTSADMRWCENPCVYVLLVKLAGEEKYIAGARLEVKSNTTDLPVEEALEELDPTFENYVRELRMKGDVGEICGLWIAKEYLGLGLAVILLRADLSLALPLEVRTLLFLCSDNTKKMLTRMGCVIEPKIGNNGTFYYPKLDLIATLMIIENMEDLGNAEKEDREKINDLHKNPNQITVEKTPKCNIRVNYQIGGLVPINTRVLQ